MSKPGEPTFTLKANGTCLFCGRPKFMVWDERGPFFDGAHEDKAAADACPMPPPVKGAMEVGIR